MITIAKGFKKPVLIILCAAGLAADEEGLDVKRRICQ
jgi:hypothetical protein